MVDENENNNQVEQAPQTQISSFKENVSGFSDILIDIKVILGRVTMPVGSFLKITRGSVLELEKPKETPVDIMANELKVAEGEIFVTDDKINIEVINVPKKRRF